MKIFSKKKWQILIQFLFLREYESEILKDFKKYKIEIEKMNYYHSIEIEKVFKCK